MHKLSYRLTMLLATVILSLTVFFFSSVYVPQVLAEPNEQMPERFDYRYTPPSTGQTEVELPTPTAAADGRVPWTLVTYQSYRNGRWDIYVSDDTGGNLQQITNRKEPDIHPNLNRGSTKVIYSSVENGNYEIAVFDLITRQRTLLTQNAWDDVNPRWSPDGTKVVFESYQYGNADIFVMNADGSNVKRLTTDPDFDGMPDWSPDGQNIAFSSRRTGGYRIYRMKADGSEQTRYFNIPYSLHPRWSPSGEYIAFDADASGNGFQEVYLMEADAKGGVGGIHTTPASLTEQLVSGWAPYRENIVYTNVIYTIYNSQYYITGTEIHVYDVEARTDNQLFGPLFDFYPDWRTTDAAAPVTTLNSLNKISPASFKVQVSINDSGGSDWRDFDVQWREGKNGIWQNLGVQTRQQTMNFKGVGGKTYYFRTRGRDVAYNTSNWSEPIFTTVESQPPVVEIDNHESVVRVGQPVLLSWDAFDIGGSDIKSYDGQYQVNGGSWIDFVKGSKRPSGGVLLDQLDSVYRFRVRATDNALNQSEWIESSIGTSGYSWGVSGRTYDNTFTPIANVDVETQPYEGVLTHGSASHEYLVYVISPTTTYTASWFKTGYDQVATTTFKLENNSTADVVLPPADNLITNWDFEEGSFAGWETNVGETFVVTESTRHTGAYAAASLTPHYELSDIKTYTGAYTYNFGDELNGKYYFYSTEPHPGGKRKATIWETTNLDGNFTPIGSFVYPSSEYGDFMQLVAHPNGAIHLFYKVRSTGPYFDIMHRSLKANGSWTDPVMISGGDGFTFGSVTSVEIDSAGGVHVFWGRVDYDEDAPGYAYLSPSGVWQPEILFETGADYNYGFQSIILDKNDRLHVIIEANSNTDGSRIYYSFKESSSTSWEPLQPLLLNSTGVWGIYAFEGEGESIHVVWEAYGNNSIYHYKIYPGKAVFKINSPPFHPTAALVDEEGTLHMVGELSNAKPVYASQAATGVWSKPEYIDISAEQLILDGAGTLHAISSSPKSYQYRTSKGLWSAPIDINNDTSNWPISVIFDKYENLKFFWSRYYRSTAVSELTKQNVLSQTVSIPADMATPILSFWYRGAGLSEDNTLQIEVASAGASVVEEITQSSGEWEHYWLDLGDFVGQTVTIQLTHTQASGAPHTWLYLDEISLGSTYADIFVQETNYPTSPGSLIHLEVPYGNQGGAAAADITMTMTLPAELTLISASSNPTVNGNQLIWHWNGLTAKQQDTMQLTLLLDETVAIGTEVTADMVITTSSEELEKDNNTTALVVPVRPYAVQFPLLMNQ